MKLLPIDPGRVDRIRLYQLRAALGLDLFAGKRSPAEEPLARNRYHCIHCGFSTPVVRNDPPPGWRTVLVYRGSDRLDECPLCAAAWDAAHGSPLHAHGHRYAACVFDPETARRVA
ncbi:MAG: hypothetical protein KF873_02125 [Gemmataceae bacterium]|nr:hypothetical protein [Gemmataceae bacterium]